MHTYASSFELVNDLRTLTSCLQEVRPGAPRAQAAQIARVIALLTPAGLGLLGPPFHEPFHATSVWDNGQGRVWVNCSSGLDRLSAFSAGCSRCEACDAAARAGGATAIAVATTNHHPACGHLATAAAPPEMINPATAAVAALARLERGRPDREILQWVFSRLGGSGG